MLNTGDTISSSFLSYLTLTLSLSSYYIVFVYLGEDVEHGGYYLVTEGLAKKHSSYRVRDYPPDETTLFGSAMGLAQVGLLPVVEVK